MERKVQRPYQRWYTADGLTTEWALPKDATRVDDVHVTVQGAAQRPADSTSGNDFEVRGFRPAYAGEKNMLKFTVAPPSGANILIVVYAE